MQIIIWQVSKEKDVKHNLNFKNLASNTGQMILFHDMLLLFQTCTQFESSTYFLV